VFNTFIVRHRVWIEINVQFTPYLMCTAFALLYIFMIDNTVVYRAVKTSFFL